MWHGSLISISQFGDLFTRINNRKVVGWFAWLCACKSASLYRKELLSQTTLSILFVFPPGTWYGRLAFTTQLILGENRNVELCTLTVRSNLLFAQRYCVVKYRYPWWEISIIHNWKWSNKNCRALPIEKIIYPRSI